MNDKFNQEVFKAIDIIRNKHKQQASVESIFEQIIEASGSESISKVFSEGRTEAFVTNNMAENKAVTTFLEKVRSYY